MDSAAHLPDPAIRSLGFIAHRTSDHGLPASEWCISPGSTG